MEFGRAFYKLSGSGNDFVAFDAMDASPRDDRVLPSAEQVRRLCRRGVSVGADGVVVLRPIEGADYQLVYYNADGTRADLCGNASLCSVRLAVELGYARADAVRFVTDAGPVTGRLEGGMPEIDLAAAAEVEPDRADLLAGHRDERRAGFARVGVPHLVIRCGDARAIPIGERAPGLRHHASLRDGANVNYVSREDTDAGAPWLLRTYERGVEAETLACGTGSVATALMLTLWSEAPEPELGTRTAGVELVTSSGLPLRVSFRSQPGRSGPESWIPSLAGSGRIVYRGELSGEEG